MDRLAKRVVARFESMSESATLAKLLEKDWAYVQFNPDTQVGEVRAGSLGLIKFQESGNDPAVIVTIPSIRLKSRAKDIMKALDIFAKVVGRTGL